MKSAASICPECGDAKPNPDCDACWDDGGQTHVAAQGRYVWACSVCRDPNYTREGQATLYEDERYCPTCDKRQPIIVFDTTLSEVAR